MLNFLQFSVNKSCLEKYTFNQSLEEVNQNDSLCGVVYFSNLAHPQWHLIPCNKFYTAHVLCHYSYESLDHPSDRDWISKWKLEDAEHNYRDFLQHIRTTDYILKNILQSVKRNHIMFLQHIGSIILNKDSLCPGDVILCDDKCLKFIRHEYSFAALNYAATAKTFLGANTIILLQYFSKVNSLRPTFVYQRSKLLSFLSSI